MAAQLYQRGLYLKVIENALVVAATRRLIRPANAPPLSTMAIFQSTAKLESAG